MVHESNGSYYAVIFSSQRTEGDNGYNIMAENGAACVRATWVFRNGKCPGFFRAGITISYWERLEAISNWKQHQSHKVAQEKGKNDWYQNYKVKICKVEREYS